MILTITATNKVLPTQLGNALRWLGDRLNAHDTNSALAYFHAVCSDIAGEPAGDDMHANRIAICGVRNVLCRFVLRATPETAPSAWSSAVQAAKAQGCGRP